MYFLIAIKYLIEDVDRIRSTIDDNNIVRIAPCHDQ